MPILTPNSEIETVSPLGSKKYSEAKRLGLPLLNEPLLELAIGKRIPTALEILDFKQWLRIEHDGLSENCIHSNILLCSCLLSKQYRAADIGILEFWSLNNLTLEVM